MSFSKFVLLFVSLVFASLLYADDASAIKDDAQAKASKISEVQAQINSVNAEASAAKDQKWKGCVGKYLAEATRLSSGASALLAKISASLAAGKISEAQSQLPILGDMATMADKLLADAQGCEPSNAPKQQTKSELQKTSTNVKSGGVSSAMNINVGNDMPTETNRGAFEGSDTADVAGIDASGVIQTTNDGSSTADVAPATTPAEAPEDAAQIEEQVPEQEEQSPTM